MVIRVHKGKSWRLVYILVTLLATAIFVAIYGINVLNPLYDDWLLGRGDLTQHYLGWCYYRKGEWTFPFGLTDRIAYPTYTSVIFTDSIPVMAVLFKIFSPILPDTFQYFGWWGLGSFIIQGILSVKILKEFEVSKLQALFASVIFILSPVMIERMFHHTALGGHWLILAAIYLFVRHRKDYDNIAKSSILWGIMGILVAGVQLYYLPMAAAILGIYILCSFFIQRKFKLKYIVPGITFLTGLVVNTYLLGGFSSNAEATSDGLGECSFNLNGLINPKGYSIFLRDMKMYYESQYEGFAYLGLGVIILLVAAAVYAVICIKNKKSRESIIYAVGYIIISLVLIAFAASPEVTFNDKLIFQLPYSSTLYRIWSIFRSTGRIVWPVCYFIYILVVVCNDRLWKTFNKNKIAIVCLVACVAIQVIDLSGNLAGKRDYFAPKIEYESPLEDEIWSKLADNGNFKHIVWVSHNIDNGRILHLAKYAHDNDMTMNTFYFARGIDVRENTRNSMQNLSDDCIYVFRADEEDNVEEYEKAANYDMYKYEADGYIIETTKELY